ncbi:glycoside hydrolase family 3 N-terminal domain-containing protein [Marinilabilia rubra]|uniref:beta-glucosidase n=1 Tax=Marinilabilia rubra TaxID=2162893 RepID=A0A2U2B9K5_9BACT|nr:glycoside hydrolase family 3 N-terminal domain-containing protein [Marinilabilia rubra]PWD99716.1 beta-glucosidase [Marinilabilia rubra]
MKKRLMLAGLMAGLFLTGNLVNGQSNAEVEKIPEVEKLLKKMTLEEKVGQMAQVTIDVLTIGDTPFDTSEPLRLDEETLRKGIVDYKIGSVLNTANNRARTREKWHNIVSTIQKMAQEETRLGIPVLYGVDAIHGTTYTADATFFPQQIGMAATWNRDLVRKGGEITAYETRASSIPWTFSPVLDMGRDPRWPRIWETFGEDVYLNSQMGIELVKGYEGAENEVGEPVNVASCLKHYLGYGTPVSGKDRTPALIPDIELRERHLPPFRAAVEAGAHSVMVNSGLINGVPVHASYKMLTEILKEELGFQGLVVTDWKDIENLHDRDRVAKTQKEAVKMAINAGVDMSMIPYNFDFCDYLVELVNEEEVAMSRIDDAVRRILNMKHKLGLFETPVTHYEDYPKFGSKEFEDAAYQTAAESVTLLKNADNILPLSKDARVLVTGPNANTMRPLNGGWSYSWQGNLVDEFAGKYSTILEAIQNKIGEENVTFVPGVEYNMEGKYWEEIPGDLDAVAVAAKDVDYIILAIGENSYTEKPGDLHDLSLSDNQMALAQTAIESGKPVIAVLNEGRPRIIREIVPEMEGILHAYIPGNFGGVAVADILFGDVNPSGKLPYTYPMYVNTLVTYDHKPSENQAKMAGMYDYESDFAIQFPFGFGLSYTSFEYSDLSLNSESISGDDELTISVTVTNTGDRTGKEVIQLFTSDLYASITPDVKRLRRFEKIELEPGESKTMTFILTAEDVEFVNAELNRVTEPGEFEVSIADLKAKFTYTR